MAIERKILRISNPTIVLDEMASEDPGAPGQVQSVAKRQNMAGDLIPLVLINKYRFTENEISRMSIVETGWLPEVSVSVSCVDGVFLAKSFPKDGDPMSIFIRSNSDTFNPIRMDVDIQAVTSSPSTDNSGEMVNYTFHGTIRIPKLSADHCRSYRSMTSFDTLKTVAGELGLGFASNETGTVDSMTWICPYDTYEKFMGDVSAASYKDDDSFFRTFVDKYYVLNMVNVNNQFGEDFEIDAAFDEIGFDKDWQEGHGTGEFETKLMLCNHDNLKGHGNFIQSFTLKSNAGDVVLQNGYRRYAQFYEQFFGGEPKDRYQSQSVEPLNTNGSEGMILQRGRNKEPEIYQNTNKYKWLGRQSSLPKGNVHQNYLYAVVQNWQNDKETDKFTLHVVLGKVNQNIYRGMRVPVLILAGGTMHTAVSQVEGQEENSPISYDRFLSGYYYVKGMKTSWSDVDAGMTHELYLTRREWPLPPQGDNVAAG